jgi:hypothetical protein
MALSEDNSEQTPPAENINERKIVFSKTSAGQIEDTIIVSAILPEEVNGTCTFVFASSPTDKNEESFTSTNSTSSGESGCQKGFSTNLFAEGGHNATVAYTSSDGLVTATSEQFTFNVIK